MTTYEILKNAQFLISKQKNHICQIFLKFPQRKISLSDFKKCDGEISKTNLIRCPKLISFAWKNKTEKRLW